MQPQDATTIGLIAYLYNRQRFRQRLLLDLPEICRTTRRDGQDL